MESRWGDVFMFAKNPEMPVRAAQLNIAPAARHFSHAVALRVAGQAMNEQARRVVIDLASAEDATTSAFAQLVLLRRALLSLGRDLCLTGLRDRAAGIFEVNRLAGVLPTA
jgi:anti-anti-sigma regulatory factor